MSLWSNWNQRPLWSSGSENYPASIMLRGISDWIKLWLQRRFNCLIPYLLFLGCIYFMYLLADLRYSSISKPAAENFLNKKEFFEELNEKYFGGKFASRTVGKECVNQVDTECYYALDQLVQNPEGEYYVIRLLTWNSVVVEGGVISLRKLITPAVKNRQNMDTTYWEVNPKVIDNIMTVRYMLEGMFVSGAVEMSSEATGDVLVIGIGGGDLVNHFASVYPNIKVTAVDISSVVVEFGRKYFGLRDHPNTKIQIRYGEEILREYAQQGKVVNAIHVDACFNELIQGGWACPVPTFATEEVMKDMAAVIGSKGIVTFNMLYGITAKQKEMVGEFLQILSPFFRNCYVYSLPLLPNNVIACHNFPSGGNLELTKESKKFMKDHGTELLLQDVGFTFNKYQKRRIPDESL
ncbi:unnamed protein product [Caenorhabditis auriculariae]|uniref:PABS domain-containing protein n=1 Tax=Caenorhabditis auriculariae TaxID=2777116 RepID=A0A8S1GUN9_9PELO|nr:unnamed protein product [Caenorhabditis auriculariae]